MERYTIWEGHMDALRKKVTRIQNKCRKFGCEFRFEEVGEEFREVVDTTTVSPVTGKHPVISCRFITVEAEGTALVNGWQFIASVEHTSQGNIFSKALTDVEIPERYRTMNPTCEHCNSSRGRLYTFIVHNPETGEFKMVGKSCLTDFTHGMSVTFASYLASLKDIFREAEEAPIGGGSWHHRYYETEVVLRYIAETIRCFGYRKSDSNNPTRSQFQLMMDVHMGNVGNMDKELVSDVLYQMEATGFDPDCAAAEEMVNNALAWLREQEASNDYMHNLKTACALDCIHAGSFGLLVSLFPTYDRGLEIQEKRKAEQKQEASSQFVGKIGERITVDVSSVKCATSWDNSYSGYPTTTYIWKILDTAGNVFTWKTSTWLNTEKPPKALKGTVKEHREYRGINQTELTRCARIA